MPTFNADQQKAIDAKNPNILVSAAAGSGKTTVMIRKIVEEITKGNKTIDQFLVITFTKDAADNMKRKLEAELHLISSNEETPEEEKTRAKKALQGIESAAVSTIHSFCLNTIKEHFDVAGVSSEVKAIDQDLPDQLFAQAYIDAVEAAFRGEGVATIQEKRTIMALFDALKQDEIQQSIKKMYETLMGIPHPFERLESLVSDPGKTWAEEVRQAVRMDLLELEDIVALIDAFLTNPLLPDECGPILEDDREIILEFQQKMNEEMDDGGFCDLLNTTKLRFAKLSIRKCPDESKLLYEDVKAVRAKLRNAGNIFDEAASNILKLSDETQIADNELIKNELQGLQKLLVLTFQEYQLAKQKIASIDFSDMEQITFLLLQDEIIRMELLERYTDIYVDESQDISAIQDAIIQSFKGEGHSLFMVGDIKQSIYRFRHAEPELFDEKRKSYEDGEEAKERRIFFRDNYRSCRTVIDCVNEVFENCMAHEVTELDYEEEDHLRANRDGEYGPVEVHLLDKSEKDATDDMLEAQCLEAGKIIGELIKQGYHYSDIAILLRSAKTDAPKMVDYFKKLNIPVFYDGPQSFYGLTEIAFFLDLLSTIENDHTDVELFGTLKNLPFSLTDEELTDIRIQKREGPFWEAFHFCADRNEEYIDHRCFEVKEQLQRWRQKAKELPAADFVWMLMRETGFYASRGAYPDGRLRQANLDALYQKALDLSKRGVLMLPDFLHEIHKIQISDKKSSDAPTIMGEEDDMVRIMTMHASKGLEFPCVLLMNLHKNLRSQNNDLQIRIELGTNRPLGIYLPLIDRTKHYKRHTFGKMAFDSRAIKNSIAEDTRLLYVAMTRAQDRLFLIGTYTEQEAVLWKSKAKLSRIWRTRSMLDMVMPTLVEHLNMPQLGEIAEEGKWRLSVAKPAPVEELEDTPSKEFDDALRRMLEKKEAKPECMWMPEKREYSPLKTSVSSLVRTLENKAPEEEETVETKRQPETILTSFRLSELPEKPAFMEEEKPDAADIGSTTHRFLRLIDLSIFANQKDCYEKAREQIDELVQKGVFNKDEASRIHIRNVADFFSSAMGQRLAAADDVKREWPFTMLISPDSRTMVQGIIDVAFKENGEWILLDYKTDRDTAKDTFVARHQMQMNWYRIAVERLTGIHVKEMWLVALRTNQIYPVQRMEPLQEDY